MKIKSTFIFLILLFSSLSCFAEEDTFYLNQTVTSWNEYNEKGIERLNTIILKGYKNGEIWTTNPNQYIFNLFNLKDVKRFIVEFDYNSAEQPYYLRVQATIDDIREDDSIRGIIIRIVLLGDKTGKSKVWKLKLVKKAYRCWRSKNQNVFTSEYCP